MKAKNTSPAAYVCRFKGGQFAYDGDEGLVSGSMFGREKMKATNLDHKAIAKAKSGAHSAHVGGGNPKGRLASYVESDETLGQREIMKRYGAPITSVSGTKVSPSRMPAHVGGGHPRNHQG